MLWVLIWMPHRGASNKYQQHTFLWKNKEKYFMEILFYLVALSIKAASGSKFEELD